MWLGAQRHTGAELKTVGEPRVQVLPSPVKSRETSQRRWHSSRFLISSLSTYYVPGAIPGPEGTALSKTDRNVFEKLTF